MTTPTRDMLVNALASLDKEIYGTTEELMRRLGDILVMKLFARHERSESGIKPKRQKTAPARRSRAQWQAFLASERPLVMEGMPELSSKLQILKEVCRRWRLVKAASGPAAPLMLRHDAFDSESEELTTVISKEEIRTSLAAQDLPCSDDKMVNAATLTEMMVIYI